MSFVHSIQRRTLARVGAVVLFLALIIGMGSSGASADTAGELRNKIGSHKDRISQLEEEISQYENELREVASEKRTLNQVVRELELTQQKLQADIAVTQNEIDATTLQIEQHENEIEAKEQAIVNNTAVLARSLRDMRAMEDSSLVEVIFANDSVSSFWQDINNLERLQEVIQVRMNNLKELKKELERAVEEQRKRRAELTTLNEELQSRKQVVQNTQQEKEEILRQTRNEEANYRQLIQEKREKKEAFEQELQSFQSELQVVIDPGRLPEKGNTVLSWPLDNVRITQYFGNTQFAQNGGYDGKGHNGIDLGTSRGTPVKSAAAGTVIGTGNTDLTCNGASYGKWVLVEHEMGLSTLYAHLSHVDVSQGATVGRSDVIGYSGNTGYSTGPHLHFTVYASQGVNVDQLESKVCGATYTLPLAPLDAYIDPMHYLPS